MVALGYVSPIPNDPTKVLKTGDTMTGDLILSGSGTDLTVDGTTTVNFSNVSVDAGEALSSVISTGVVSGGLMTVNAGISLFFPFKSTGRESE